MARDLFEEEGRVLFDDEDEPQSEAMAIPKENTGDRSAQFVKDMQLTAENIKKVYPVLETLANMATSAYGVPISGIAGGVAAPFIGADKASKVIEKVQDVLVYKPQTKAGAELTETASYPQTLLSKGGETVAGPIAEAGYPGTATVIKTAVEGAPALLGLKKTLSKTPSLPLELEAAVKKGVNKAIRPTVVGKQTRSQISRYYDNAVTAVKEIIRNKDKIDIVDEYGNKKAGLPENLDQFSQAIDQTKKVLFDEYDSLSKTADASGVQIDLKKTSNELNTVLSNKTLKDFSPETIQYAKNRMKALSGRKKYSASDTQEAIKFLNQTLEKFYKDPSPALKGQAMVDSLIANNLRKQLDTAIENATGVEYQPLKSKYGAIKILEKEMNHRAIVDARKNTKGIIDFSDIFSGSQAVAALLKKEPITMATSAAAKGVSHYYKMLNDPNKHVKTMFSEVEKLSYPKKKTNIVPGVSILSTSMGQNRGLEKEGEK